MRIGLAGIGLMGRPLAEKILVKHKGLFVYNRTRSKTESLTKFGAIPYSDNEKFVIDSEVIVLMLSDYDAVNSILFENYDGVYEGKTVIQMSTISPSESRGIAERVKKLRGEFIEAPVLGSIPQIEKGELIVLVGGSEKIYHEWLPFFDLFSNKIIHVGEIGTASAMKLALNQFIISETAAFSMSLGYLREKNLDIDQFMDILKASSLYAPTFDKKLQMMIDRNFDKPNFPLKHLLKDLDLILGEFGSNNINTIPLKGIRKILIDSIEKGLSEKDYSALYNSIHPSIGES